jgi:hypothetical protein
MAEYRFFDDGTVPYVSTAEFHTDRDRAPHLEQPDHSARLRKVAELVRKLHPQSIVDLGCGDGGLLSLLQDIPARGYDFQPSNVEGWAERNVTARALDFIAHPEQIIWGELAIMTEVLEHLADPHGFLKIVSQNTRYVVASSPHGETPENHAMEHAWGWDMEGYQQLFNPHWIVLQHFKLGWCQILTARSKNI